MRVSVETTSGLERKLTVGVPADEVDSAVDKKLAEASKNVRLPGFRPGKVPMSVMKQRFGPGVRQEVLGDVINQSFQEAVMGENLRPAGQPSIEAKSVESGKDVEYVATFEIYPTVSLNEVKDFEVTKLTCEIGESDVNDIIEVFQKQQGQLVDVDRAAEEGDTLTIDFEGFKDGVPSKGKNLAKKLYDDIRKGMGINEGTLPQYMIEDLITEGVYDPGIFKAVFLMGGPGSGKSAVVDKLALKALGLKLVNTDKAFENGLKKAGLSLDLRGADFDKVDPIRAKAKKITGKNMDAYIRGRLGMIFDTTAANKSKIVSYKKLLDKLGYEYKMVFVRTSLENAQKRNDMRARKLPPEIVKGDWEKAMKSAKEYKSLFKKDFIEITNDDTVQALDAKANQLFSKMMTWTSKYPSNKQALKWRERMLLRKKG